MKLKDIMKFNFNYILCVGFSDLSCQFEVDYCSYMPSQFESFKLSFLSKTSNSTGQYLDGIWNAQYMSLLYI